MIFNSLTYIVFLALVTLIYWRLRGDIKLLVIFSSSIIFYGFWRLEFVGLLLFSVCLDYFIAKQMVLVRLTLKKYLLFLSLACNVGLLIFFKYLYFLHDNISLISSIVGFEVPSIDFDIILPLGISFYTFQTISYTVDVFRGHLKPEKNFLAFASFVTFFPQLIAGPVLRAGEVIPQLKESKSFKYEDVFYGIRRILYGLFLKVLVADNIAVLVDEGFLVPSEYLSAFDVWTLAFLFGFQIYFDFSAYSHIAIGSARLLGIKFPENFNYPYAAINPKDFWKRWHISLSSWIRDYLYLPLTGAKIVPRSEGGLANVMSSKQGGSDKALFLSWSIMGLWHGASWTFLIWGLYHAVVIYLYRIVSKIGKVKLTNNLSIFITLPIMMLGWIPFRAVTVTQTFELWGIVINPMKYLMPLGLRENSYIIASILVCGFFAGWSCRSMIFDSVNAKKSFIETAGFTLFYAVLFLFVIVFLRPASQFIYFQF